jgi:ABC-type multidrug transport system ATPase subunit
MGRKRKVDILNSFDGVLEAGEMLVVLGPPGSGCSTLLKTIAGEMNGIYLDEKAEVNYRGESLIRYVRLVGANYLFRHYPQADGHPVPW